MLQSEFEERVGFTVTSDCYHECIEPEYNASKLGKDEWCKQWKKDQGIQRAYSWMAKKVEALSKCYDDASKKLADYNAKVKEINMLKDEAQVNANTLAAAIGTIKQACEGSCFAPAVRVASNIPTDFLHKVKGLLVNDSFMGILENRQIGRAHV